MEWSQPEIRGDSVGVRAGHASVCIYGNWYIVGGGDNKSGKSPGIVYALLYCLHNLEWLSETCVIRFPWDTCFEHI